MEIDLRTLTKVFLKAAGIYLLVIAISGAVQLFWYQVEMLGPYLTTLVVYLALGIALLWFPGTVMSHVLRIQGEAVAGEVAAARFLGVGIILMGIYFAATGLFAIVFTMAGARWYYSFTEIFGGARGPELGPEQFASLVSSAVRLCIGLLMWLGWRRFMAMAGEGKHDR
jgi:hypothetical protein